MATRRTRSQGWMYLSC